MRTHTCGELNKSNINKQVTLCGWVDSIREHGKVAFINLRDRYGITQIVFEKDINKIKQLKNEFVLKIQGKVRKRPQINKNIPTGEIELLADKFEILNTCDILPLDSSVESTPPVGIIIVHGHGPFTAFTKAGPPT